MTPIEIILALVACLLLWWFVCAIRNRLCREITELDTLEKWNEREVEIVRNRIAWCEDRIISREKAEAYAAKLNGAGENK